MWTGANWRDYFLRWWDISEWEKYAAIDLKDEHIKTELVLHYLI